jgi:hypothetical protein
MGLLHQYPWVTHQHPWAKAAWLLMSARFVGMNVFHCRLELMLPMKFNCPVDLSRGEMNYYQSKFSILILMKSIH